MANVASPALRVARLSRPDDFAGWREAARAHLNAGTPPELLLWEGGGSSTTDLFGDAVANDEPIPRCAGGTATRATVPRAFLDLAERVICHRDAARFGLLYRVLWRLNHGEPRLLDSAADDDVRRLHVLGKRISRERHKMHAFVRFRRTPGVEPEHFGAWFEPEHHTLRLSSGFFVRRFANMRWSIVTPDESAHWDGDTLHFGPGGERGDRADGDAMESLWRTYFANIFNPARLRLDAMRSEMPVKYWKNLPEAPLIADLVHRAGIRTERMIDAAPDRPPRYAAKATWPAAATCDDASVDDVHVAPPERFDTLHALHARTSGCARCDHACRATQTVNGIGRAGAALMLVGEQPGDREDLTGRPFVGPAGTLLREVLAELDLDDDTLFMTNAVRHFHHEPRGKRRLHRRPDIEHVSACRPWLFEEIRLVRPRAIVALGATAGRALLGRPVSVQRERGEPIALYGRTSVHPTWHPAAILRQTDAGRRAALRAALTEDIRAAHASTLDTPEAFAERASG